MLAKSVRLSDNWLLYVADEGCLNINWFWDSNSLSGFIFCSSIIIIENWFFMYLFNKAMFLFYPLRLNFLFSLFNLSRPDIIAFLVDDCERKLRKWDWDIQARPSWFCHNFWMLAFAWYDAVCMLILLTGMECFHVYWWVFVINYAFLIGIFGSVELSKKIVFSCLI